MKTLCAWAGTVRSERGATATEYALLISGIAIVLVGVIAIFGGALAASWETLAELL